MSSQPEPKAAGSKRSWSLFDNTCGYGMESVPDTIGIYLKGWWLAVPASHKSTAYTLGMASTKV
jgi:hypothetical protein